MGGAMRAKEELKVIVEIRGRVDVIADFNRDLQKLVEKYGAKLKKAKGRKRKPR